MTKRAKSSPKTRTARTVGVARDASVTRVALVVPHLYICDCLRGRVIFSPGELARELARGLSARSDLRVTLFTPGPVALDGVPNVTADWNGLEAELQQRGYPLLTLAARHPSLFVALARQLQAEIIAAAYAAANRGEFDLVHIYTNEEDLALQFADLCQRPVLFTHHDPYNFLIKYKSVFPRYKYHNFISTSMVQQRTAPAGTNFVANIYHGLDETAYHPSFDRGRYFLYCGRLVSEKGVELAAQAASAASLPLKIIGKYYQDGYFCQTIEPLLDDKINFLGFQQGREKQALIRGAAAVIMPSRFAEPFGLTAIEALALGTPVIASKNGALPEIINQQNGFLVDVAEQKSPTDDQTVAALAGAMRQIWQQDNAASTALRRAAHASFLENFTLDRMVDAHAKLYQDLARRPNVTKQSPSAP